MSLRNLIEYRRPFFHDGRRYRLRGPTYATVFRALSLFAVEAAAIARQWKKSPDLVGWRVIEATIDWRSWRIVDVLATCVETEVDPALWPTKDLAREILSLCDVNLIVSSLALDELGDAKPEQLIAANASGVAEDCTDEVAGVVQLATLFHLTPVEVMEWPFEAVISTWKALAKLGIVKEKEPDFLELCRRSARRVEA